MNKRLKSAAIMMALILTISVFTSLAATTAVAAHTTTTTKITASNVVPFVNKAVTFTVTLKAGTNGLSKPVKIWHTQNGVRSEDGTHTTTAAGVYKFTQAFGSKGQRVYHAAFVGDSKYGASSGAVTVNVQPIPTTMTITASKTWPLVNEPITITATLKAGATGLSKTVKIWHTQNGVRYEDGTHNTVNGVYKFTKAFGSKGQRVYHAAFVGDSKYGASSGAVTVDVYPIPTTMTITASKTNQVVNEKITYTVTLKAGTTGLSKPFKLLYLQDGHPVSIIRRGDGVDPHTVNGVFTISGFPSFSSPGQRIFVVLFAGDSQYDTSAAFVKVNVQ